MSFYEWMKGLFILSCSTFINDKKWCNEGKSALNGKKSFKDNTDLTGQNVEHKASYHKSVFVWNFSLIVR